MVIPVNFNSECFPEFLRPPGNCILVDISIYRVAYCLFQFIRTRKVRESLGEVDGLVFYGKAGISLMTDSLNASARDGGGTGSGVPMVGICQAFSSPATFTCCLLHPDVFRCFESGENCSELFLRRAYHRYQKISGYLRFPGIDSRSPVLLSASLFRYCFFILILHSHHLYEMITMMKKLSILLCTLLVVLSGASLVSAARPIGGDQGWYEVQCNVDGATGTSTTQTRVRSRAACYMSPSIPLGPRIPRIRYQCPVIRPLRDRLPHTR